jgi:ABC-type transport system substrate-binding protein
MNLLRQGRQETDEAKRNEIGKQIYMNHADGVWTIGLVSNASVLYGVYLAKNNLGNVPRRIINDDGITTPSNALPMTFYYK